MVCIVVSCGGERCALVPVKGTICYLFIFYLAPGNIGAYVRQYRYIQHSVRILAPFNTQRVVCSLYSVEVIVLHY